MATEKHPSISVSGALHRRLSGACTAAAVPISRATEAIVHRALDELEADPALASSFCAALVKAAPPSSTVVTQPRKVYVPSSVWFRLHRHRRAGGDFMSNVEANTAMINRMLDKAGAK